MGEMPQAANLIDSGSHCFIDTVIGASFNSVTDRTDVFREARVAGTFSKARPSASSVIFL